MIHETTASVPSTIASASLHFMGEEASTQNYEIVRQQTITAKVAREFSVEELKRANWILRYHQSRLWVAHRGLPGWACGLIAGSATAISVTTILIFVLGAGLPLIFLGLVLAYTIAGGGVLWVFRDFEGECDGNRVQVRADYLRVVEEKRQAMLEVVKEKTSIENSATQLLRSIQQKLQSDVYKSQIEAARLLAIDPGRLYPDEFERHVADIFKHLGFSVEITGQNKDQGVDVVACKGTVRFAIQAKRYLGAVGNAAIQEVYAGMAYYKCHRCAVVTNSEFTSSAIALAQSTGCLLIGGDKMGLLIRGEITF